MAETAAPFVWGNAGEMLTPGQIAARRKVADAMIAQGSDYSPVRSPWQGVARVAQAMLGGYESGQVDRAEKAGAESERQIVAALLGQLPSQGAPAPAAGPAVNSPAPAATSVLPGADAPASPVSRPAVLPSAKVWGDKEAEEAGIYEKPASAASAAPIVAKGPDAAAAPGTPVVQPTAPSPGVSTVAGAINPAIVQAVSSPYVSDRTRSLGMTLLADAMKPKARFSQETDQAGNIWNINGTTGERTVALKREKDEEPARPMTAEERKLYGIPEGAAVAMTSKGPKAIGAGPGTTVNVGGGGSDKQIFDAFDERAKLAKSSAVGLVALRDARSALDAAGGAITGAGADTKLLLSKAGAAFGITDPKAAENTETFRAAIAPQVGAMLKSTIGTANISNSDREFAEKAAGGSITLEAGSIKRLLTIMERAAIARLQEHQEALDAVYPDTEKHKRERALFGVKVPDAAAPPPPAGATRTGIQWSVE